MARRVEGGRRLKKKEGEAERDREKGRGGGERKRRMGRGKERESKRPQINSLLVMLLKRSMVKFSHL